MANELDDLLGMVGTEADRTQLQQLLDRNPVAKERAEAQSALFAALANGDNASISAAQERFRATELAKPAATATTSVASASAAASLDELTRMVTSQVNTALESGGYMKKADAESLADQRAEALFTKKAGDLLATAAQTSDQIYQVRRSHEREFGAELDTPKFTEYLNSNTGKFTNLSAAHDAYVSEDRINKRIATGIDEGLKAKTSSSSVPGTTLTSVQNDTPLANMMRYNDKLTNPNGTNPARGVAIDAGVQALRAIRAARGEAVN